MRLYLNIEHVIESNHHVFSLDGDLDLDRSRDFKEKVKNTLNGEYEKPSCILDFKKLNYIDSTGLGALISLQNHFKQKDGALYLASIPTKVKKVFELARLNNFFKMYGTKDEAHEELDKNYQ